MKGYEVNQNIITSRLGQLAETNQRPKSPIREQLRLLSVAIDVLKITKYKKLNKKLKNVNKYQTVVSHSLLR